MVSSHCLAQALPRLRVSKARRRLSGNRHRAGINDYLGGQPGQTGFSGGLPEVQAGLGRAVSPDRESGGESSTESGQEPGIVVGLGNESPDGGYSFAAQRSRPAISRYFFSTYSSMP